MFQNYFARSGEDQNHYTRASGTSSVQYAGTKYRRFVNVKLF